MKILGTGLDGLVGSRIIELLSDKHEFENLSISTDRRPPFLQARPPGMWAR